MKMKYGKTAIRILLPLLLAGAIGCRSSRQITQVVAPKDSTVQAVVIDPTQTDSARLVRETFARIDSGRIDYKTFAAKVKVVYKDTKDRNFDFNAFIRMRRDSVIWVSIIAALGVEAFRVMITPDSVTILDKLEKTVQYTTAPELRKVTQVPFDFFPLQELIIGNPVYMDGEIRSFREEEGLISLSIVGSFFKHLLTYARSDMSLQASKLDDVDVLRSRTAKLTYADYQPAMGRRFSNRRQLTLAEKMRIDVDLEFKQVEFDVPLNYPFAIPRNYKVK